MKLRTFVLSAIIISFGVCTIIQAQVVGSGNTIILMQYSADRVVLDADSREGTPWGRRDDFCKIIQPAPRFFFFATGRAIIFDRATRGEKFNAYTIAREAFHSLKRELRNENAVALIGSYWGILMREKYEESLVADPVGTVSGLANGQIVKGVFGGSVNNKLEIYMVFLMYAMPPEVAAPTVDVIVERVSEDDGIIKPFGDPAVVDLIREYLDGTTARASSAVTKANAAIKSIAVGNDERAGYFAKYAIEAASEWVGDESTIAPPVDILVLHRNGSAKWISRKAQCRQ